MMKKNILILIIAIILVLSLVLVGHSTVSSKYNRFNVYTEKMDKWSVYIGVFDDIETGTICYFMVGLDGVALDCIEK